MIEEKQKELADRELETLLEYGFTFTVPKRSVLKYFGKPERTFLVRQPYVRTMDRLSKDWLQMDLSIERLQEDLIAEGKQLVAKHALRFARIITIAYLNSEWKYKLFGGLLAYYFSCRITPQKLLGITQKLNQSTNLMDFIRSTRLMSANLPTTTPARVEKTPEEKRETTQED